MDHLDLDGIFSSPASNWMLPAFDQQDGNFLSASRQMLEPIMEETSEDEDNQNWSQYENVWSSESDTGSVIRIELHNDQDSISERDFACPAKRPRRDDLVALEDGVQLRKYQRNDYLTADNQENFRKRFDEFYSDSDSLSYNSLSRSSSLIQFESLERQLQSDHGSLGNSSPSLLNFDANNDAKGSNGCLRRFESSESRLHQTYFDLDKIDFENTLIFTEDRCNQNSKSDSESSDNSILSHEERILKPRNAANSSDHRSCYKGKSSAENLSEDSGYCEHISALRIKSKSIPNFIKKTEKFCEEDEFDIHKSLEMIYNSSGGGGGLSGSSGHEFPMHFRSEPQALLSENKRIFKTKIAAATTRNCMEQNDEKQHRICWHNGHQDGDVINKIASNTNPSSTSRSSARSPSGSSSSSSSSSSSASSTSSASSPRSSPFASSSLRRMSNRRATTTTETTKRTTSKSTTPPLVSSSLPDVRVETDHVANSSLRYLKSYDSSDNFENFDGGQFTTVSSVPKDLNLAGFTRPYSTTGGNYKDEDEDENDCDNFSWSLRHPNFNNKTTLSYDSENRLNGGSFSLGGFSGSQSAKSLAKPAAVQNYMNASYNNLTLLDYSGRSRSNRNSLNMSEYGGNSKRSSREFELGKGNFLLDEISMHFDKNVSILSDREPNSDLVSKFLDEERLREDESPLKPVTRRCHSHKEPRVTSAIIKPPRKMLDKSFDQDPTVLRTSYAESLEKCNFDPKELSNTDLRDVTTHSTPIKRLFVASTPNLNTFRDRNEEIEDDLHISSAHTSMNPLPGDKKLGILLPGGSRNSLGKGVSFCPVVSEISWQEQSSEECVEPNSLDNIYNRSIVAAAHARTTVEPATTIMTQAAVSATCGQQDRDQNKNPNRSDAITAISNASTVSQEGVVDFESAATTPRINSSPLSWQISGDDQKTNFVMDQSVSPVISDSVNNNSSSNNNKKMSSVVGVKSATMPVTGIGGGGSATGADVVNSKFKPKPDEKHHKHSFLSRFTGGFRFSLRRKKKHQQQQSNGELGPIHSGATGKSKGKKSVADGAVKTFQQTAATTSSSQKSPDFIYIPLKGPLMRQQVDGETPYAEGYGDDVEQGPNERHLPTPGPIPGDNNHVLLGKPPLPKQPPRVVGVCEKMRSAGPQHQHHLGGINSNSRHAPGYRSSSQPREIDENFLDNERRYYGNQLNGTMNADGCSSAPPLITMTTAAKTSATSKSTIKPVAGPGGAPVLSRYPQNGGATPSQLQPTGANNDHCKIGLIETNLDTHETVISGKTRSLMELGPQVRHTLSKQSACNDAGDAAMDDNSRRPHKSMEFLLDKENQKNVLPPENELQKSHDSTAALSEHQLRVQASLQRLNIPDWFRQYSSTPKSTESGYKPGSFTRKRASDSGRWTGLNSKTTSLSSLGSQRSDRSPLLLSPSAHSHHGGQLGFSRWSTSYLNSTQTSPSVSTRGSFSRGGPANSSFISVGGTSVRNSFRQPYLGWRSQEKLAQPRTPHERLASSLLSQKPPKQEPAVTPEIQSSIKEVTSAIVHYVNDQTNRAPRSRSTSPSSRKCWLESSFVGIRPVESPQTPIIENSFNTNTNTTTNTATSSIHSGITSTSDALRMNGVATPLPSLSIAPDRSSPSSASLEDVLASLLGLPTDTYRSTGDTANEIMYRMTSSTISSLQVEQNRFRRRSEGDAQKQQQQQNQQQQNQQQQHKQIQQQQNANPQIQQVGNNNVSETSLPNQASRRVSLDSSESKTTSELLVKCRNTKCDQSSNPVDAKKFYKSCHNCTHLYCSRECRRAHWEKHRKACLHSRVSNLCRQVLAACKDDMDTLRHLSLLARKGYLSQGRGIVRVLFRSPENAEAFIKNGFQCLGEASYVRWPDLMPAEMGLELYSELLKLSTEYKPESKMLIYVAICVVSEAPGTATAPVKWERQLVSRCAKLKICKSILSELDQAQQAVIVPEASTEILILTFNPQKKNSPSQRELISTNIQTILGRRGVVLRKHYPEIYQRLQTFADGQTDRFMPVTIHPRDNQTGQGFVCIMMPTHGDNEPIRLPINDSGNKVITIDVGEELLES